MRKVNMLSEGMWVVFWGSGCGMVKEVSFREDTIRYLLSGYIYFTLCELHVPCMVGRGGKERRLTLSLISAAAAVEGTGSCRS